MTSSEDDIFSGLWNDYYHEFQQSPLQDCLDSSSILTVIYPHGNAANSIRIFKKEVVEPSWHKIGLRKDAETDSSSSR